VKPRERLAAFGAEALSPTELIAIILRTGSKGMDVFSLAEKMLGHFGSLRSLSNASIEELSRFPGVNVVKAMTLKASLELGRRLFQEYLNESEPLNTPEKIYESCFDLKIREKEVVRVLCFDSKLRLLAKEDVHVGSSTSSMISTSEVLKTVLRRGGVMFALVHNHPSGDPTPSEEDIEITRKLERFAEELELPLVDHVIIGSSGFYSFRRAGIIHV